MNYTHVKCLKEVSDDLGVYCKKDEVYEIYELYENQGYAIIETLPVSMDFDETDEMRISLDDKDFLFLELPEEE